MQVWYSWGWRLQERIGLRCGCCQWMCGDGSMAGGPGRVWWGQGVLGPVHAREVGELL